MWEYSAANPSLKAGVAFYGPLVDPEPLKGIWPKSATDLAADMKAPVLGLYGEADQGIPVAQVEAMKAKLQAAGKKAEFKIYPGSPARLPRRLPAELPQGGRGGCLEPADGLVQGQQGAGLTQVWR